MVQIKFIIETDKLRQPKKTIKFIHDFLRPILGEVLIEQPKGYLTEEDLK